MSETTREKVIRRLLEDRPCTPVTESASAYAPANIALCKYWGKRDETLNLPVTSSLSISLGHLGTETRLRPLDGPDRITLNGELVTPERSFATKVSAFLDMVRPSAAFGFEVHTTNTIPTAAGLASSASGFAALALALDQLFGWQLNHRMLSILARLGSGSASRSVFDGFVEWHAGQQDDGMDSFAEPVPYTWPELCIGVVHVSEAAKPIGSREAMRRTLATSALYQAWPARVAADLNALRQALEENDFQALGAVAEGNALAMHATMIDTRPAILYWLPESIQAMQAVWALRRESVPVYFTMDAGPNLKLLFEHQHADVIKSRFPRLEIVQPMASAPTA